MTDNRLSEIKDYFTLLKRGFLWMESHPDDVKGNEAMIERAKKEVFSKGVKLGVSEEFSAAFLVFGPSIDWDLVREAVK